MAANDMGDVEILSSPNLKQDKWAIMQDSQETFKQYLEVPAAARLGAGQSLKGRSQLKKSLHPPGLQTSLPEGSVSYVTPRPAKRQRSRTLNGLRTSLPVTIPVRQPRDRRSRRPSVNPASLLQVEVQETEQLEKWFREAFLTMQQVACRLVAKVWIKKIHPKKQSTHPYNGGMPRDQPPDSNRTRPPYWPIGVIHREPDHIGRDDRVNLLVCLIMHTPQPIILNPADPESQLVVPATELLDCLEEKRGELKDGPYEIVKEVIRVRHNMERFECGEIDGDNVVFLPDYSDRSTSAQLDSETELSSADGHGHGIKSEGSAGDEMGDEHTLTPESSTLHSPVENPRGDDRSLGSRPRRSATTEKARSRLTATQRSRPSLSAAGQLPSVVIPRGPQESLIDMAMGMGRFECNMDATMQDAMIDQPGGDIHQIHAQTPMMLGMNQELPTELSMVPDSFDQDVNASAHEVVLTDHRSPHDMMDGISHAMQSQSGVNYQAWLPALSNISPGPSHSMFGMASHIPIQAQELQHGYFDPSPADLVGGIQSSLPLMNPSASYQHVSHHLNRTLPVRGMSESHTRMIPPTEHNLDASTGSAPYYHM
ncbi:uncharacterized protein A1O9_02157 [Exophiala aquamarina CBS 119918]|uniref:Subtelomeric hrmA-associated cluster protein AFUB-079030/YDR124W-like helical bundle domain-containing protein n=1 Tax=Exophiala aquamarina CBS 119918 TaxID=1182545 RepID=A0A072PL33_9EURO|nr:uncharacterized protein A1O9_02157 [Exophiala aquamarina CBS 119918]KEF60596.1 hypothetical protein A1O9_02157 [Exophiala aquamarina CBS 119918]